MPTAAWISAAKKTPMEPVFYAACESVDAVNVTQNLASDWSAGVMNNVEIFPREGNIGGAGVRPQLLTFNNLQVNWRMWGRPPLIYPAESPWFIPPAAGFVESIAAEWRIMFPWMPTTLDTRSLLGWPATLSDPQRYHCGVITVSPQKMPLLRLGLFPAHALAPMDGQGVIPDKIYGTVAYNDVVSNVYPVNNANFLLNFRAQVGTITTKPFDLGSVPNVPSRVLFDHMVTGGASITYTAQGSNDSIAWLDLGSVIDGGEIAPYRYYRITATMTSTGYDTPEIYSIRVVGGNSQYVYFGDHRGQPALPGGGEVSPYLESVSSSSSKIALKDKPTVGDLTMTLSWMPLTSDLVQSTGKRRSVTVYLGFVGLAAADYEPYFTGTWDGYTADPERRTFTVKLRDVWKKFKQKIPVQQISNGATVPINYLFGRATDGSGAGNTLNILDAIVQVADLAKAPDRFIDKAAFAALKISNFPGTEWNVYRVLTEQKDSDELLKELSVTAGVFLIPAPSGKLTPLHYETAIAQTPTVTLDAAQIQFSGMTPDMADTVTRHNIYFNLRSDDQGRKLGGGNPSDYASVYTTIGGTSSVIAERDREEVVVGEWFDNWGLAAAAANGTPNPLTKLADRFTSWYTPVALVGGKSVATTKTTVQASNVPLRYYSDVMPGRVVYLDNLRLPCPAASWEGFSKQIKFIVLSWAIDPKNFTLKLDLYQVDPLAYTANPTWYAYSQWDLYPPASGLALTEQFVATATGIAIVLSLSFRPAIDYRVGYYEVWVSESGGDWQLSTTIPAAAVRDVTYASIAVRTGADYRVAVVTVTGRGARQPIVIAPTISATVVGTAGVVTPPDSGLSAPGGGFVFFGRDCLLTWDSSTIPSALLGGYLLEILTLEGVVVRTVTVTDPQFAYTAGMGATDFVGVPTPAFLARVSTINRGGWPATPQTVAITHGVPAPLTTLETATLLRAVQVSISYPVPEDLDCVEIWSAATNDLAAVDAALAGTTLTGIFTHFGLATAETRYYWGRVRNSYGQVSAWYPATATAGVLGTSSVTEVDNALNQTQFKGSSFLRAVSTPATPSGGTYSSPTATGWSDGIPADNNQPLWMCTRLFTSDGLLPQQTVWTASQKIGTPSVGAKTQFSVDSVSWHDTPAVSDVYMRSGTSTDNGATWAYSGAVKIRGENGRDGVPGQTPYLHIRYSDDGGVTFTAASGKTAGHWIGQYTDFVAADSTSPASYTWAKTLNFTSTSAIAPTSPTDGDIWIDTSSTIAQVRFRVAGAWTLGMNATPNTITVWSVAPTTASNGDIWVDTSATPHVTKLRVAGAWEIAATYIGQGDVSTGLIAASAVTGNAVNVGVDVVVDPDRVSHLNQVVSTITYTAQGNIVYIRASAIMLYDASVTRNIEIRDGATVLYRLDLPVTTASVPFEHGMYITLSAGVHTLSLFVNFVNLDTLNNGFSVLVPTIAATEFKR